MREKHYSGWKNKPNKLNLRYSPSIRTRARILKDVLLIYLIYKKYLYKVYVFSSFIFYKIDIIDILLSISNDYKLINYLFARDWLIYFSCIFIFLFTWHIAYINMQLVWNLAINYGDPCCITYIKSWIWILIFFNFTFIDRYNFSPQVKTLVFIVSLTNSYFGLF